MGIRRDKYDATFSDLIRARADYTCERCGKSAKNGEFRMDCAHIFGRRHRSVRWDTDNAFCLCFTCHQTLGEDPIEHTRFVKEKLGDTCLEFLVARKNQIKKWTTREKDEMRAHYQSELKRIQHERKFGKTGYIEVVNWA